jgi:DNA-binding XRE family transcriptional regulator
MGEIPKFLVNLHPGGRISIIASDGSELGEEHVVWVKKLITRELRSANFNNGGQVGSGLPLAGDRVKTRRGVESEMDPLVAFLRDERLRQDISAQDLARACFVSSSALNDYERGRSIPSIETLHAWAPGLGHKIAAIPIGARIPSVFDVPTD